MTPWDELPEEDKKQIGGSVLMWFRALGTNEVLAEWFGRAGSYPDALWREIPRWRTSNTFYDATSSMRDELYRLASKALEQEDAPTEDNA